MACLFVCFVLGKIKCVHTQTQGDVWNKLCDSPLPHLEHELKDMRARSVVLKQVQWHAQMWSLHFCLHGLGVAQLLFQDSEWTFPQSLAYLIWSTVSQTQRLPKVEMSLTLWCRYKRDKYKLWAFTDDSPPLSQLWSVSLPFRAVADGWQAWAMAIQLCNAERETAICTFEDFKMLPC